MIRTIVRIFAVVALLAFAFCFAWYFVPPVPISIPIVVGFGAALGILLMVTRPYRRRPPQ